MIDYTDITLKASKYNFDSVVSKVTNDEIKVMLTDRYTGKEGTLTFTEPMDIDIIEGAIHCARQRLDLIA